MSDQRVEENVRKTTDRIADRCRQRADEVDDEASFLLRRAASIIEHQAEQIDELLRPDHHEREGGDGESG